MKQLLKNYFSTHQTRLFAYMAITLSFYILNFVFFSRSIDVPVDLLFSVFYIVFVPGIFVFITLYKSDLKTINSNQAFFVLLLIHSIIPIIISLLFSVIYTVIRMNFSYWQNMTSMHAISFPLIFMAMIFVIEIKTTFRKWGLKLLILSGLILSFLILSILLTSPEYYYLYLGVTLFYLFIIPLIILFFHSRKVLLKSTKHF